MTIRFGDSGSQSKVGPLYFGDGKGTATKVGTMWYGDGRGKATKIYSSKYAIGHVLWKADNDYGVGLGNTFSDSPYVISGNRISFTINTNLLITGIKVIFNSSYYYGKPYSDGNQLWEWNGGTIPDGYSNNYKLPSSNITILKTDFGNQTVAYSARKQGNQATVNVIADSNGLSFTSNHGGTIFDVPASNGYSILLVKRVEAY